MRWDFWTRFSWLWYRVMSYVVPYRQGSTETVLFLGFIKKARIGFYLLSGTPGIPYDNFLKVPDISRLPTLPYSCRRWKWRKDVPSKCRQLTTYKTSRYHNLEHDSFEVVQIILRRHNPREVKKISLETKQTNNNNWIELFILKC